MNFTEWERDQENLVVCDWCGHDVPAESVTLWGGDIVCAECLDAFERRQAEQERDFEEAWANALITR